MNRKLRVFVGFHDDNASTACWHTAEKENKVRVTLHPAPTALHWNIGTLPDPHPTSSYFLKHKTPPQKFFAPKKTRRKISRLRREICGPFFFSAASRRWPFSKSALRAISCANLRQRRSAWTFSNPGPLPQTDSTIAPPQNRRFSLTNVSWLLDTRKDALKRVSAYIILFAEDYRTMTSGW